MEKINEVKVLLDSLTTGETSGGTSGTVSLDVEVLKREIKELEKLNIVTVLELGKRFILLKGAVESGEWTEFITTEIELSHDAVNKYMKIAKNFNDSELVQKLGIKKAYLLISVDKADRDEFIKVNDVINMTYKELAQVVKEYKESKGLIKPISIDADRTVKNINRLVSGITEQYTQLGELDNLTKDQKDLYKLCKNFIESIEKLNLKIDEAKVSKLVDATN